jgi:AcrR family transcriptional regulator
MFSNMPKLDSSTPASTKTALLDSAERLFAQNGIDGTSLRAITQDAGANLASVNYHYGSKQGLVKAVFERRLRPLNDRRLELLDEALLETDRSARLRSILRAFVGPVLQMRFDRKRGNPEFIQLLGRTFAESPGQPKAELLAEFEQVLSRFISAFSETVPELESETLAWRFHFTVGSMAYTAAVGRPLQELFQSGDVDYSHQVDRIIEHLVDFLETSWIRPEGHRDRVQS